jgi:ribonuclease VapC
MVIDASALIAILLGEPETRTFSSLISADSKRLVSVFSALETSIVIESRKGDAGGLELDLLLHRVQIEIISMNPEQFELARSAWRSYGKGQHPAGLNIGDCCSYALSKYSGEPLLFKGNDFSKTDVRSVAWTQGQNVSEK